MSLDSTTFPLVWMRQLAAGQPQDTVAEFAEFSRLLQREQAFVLLCDRRMDENGEHDRDERTQIALWKRDHREALARWVKGMVLIEPDDVRRQAAAEFVDFASRFWGYPVQVVDSEAQARELAQRWLDQ